MAATEYPCRLALGLLALSLATHPPGVRAAPLVQQAAVSTPAADPDARVHQRLIIKLKDAETGVNPAQRARSAKVAISDLANRVQPAFVGPGSMPLSLHRSIRPGLHVAAAGQPLKRAEMQQLIQQLRQDPRVEYAEIDERIQPQYSPSDPYYGSSQWNLRSSAPGVEGGASLPGAWDFGLGANAAAGQGVVVAVLDTGIRPHAELAGRILPGYDFVSDTDTANDQNDQWDSDPSDPGDWVSESDRAQAAFAGCAVSPSSWHGTSMAGTIAAASNNGRDIAGVAPLARILPVRVFGKCGGHVSDVIAGLYWSVGIVPEPPAGSNRPPVNPNPARVINLSMAAEGSCSQAFQEAIDKARALGALVVAAAGNHASGDTSTALPQPASCRGVIAVTAHTRRGDLADYANVHSDVTLSAPGGGSGRSQLTGDGDLIIALSNSGSSSPSSDSLTQIAGTSIAAAQVSGVAALLLGLQPGWNADQIELALTRSARGFPDNSYCFESGLCGAGMLDAAAAVRWQQADTAPAVQPENTSSGGGGGAAGWPELLVLLSVALLTRLRRGPPAA